MEAQIDLLEGKRKSGVRLHETIATYAEQSRLVAGLPPSDAGGVSGNGTGTARGGAASIPMDRCRRACPG